MKPRTEKNSAKNKEGRNHTYTAEEFKYFHFDLSEKGHEVVLPNEEESSWQQLGDITWDPGRGD